jgi:hypothetical protein
MDIVALGEPSTPVTCWATAGEAVSIAAMTNVKAVIKNNFLFFFFITLPPFKMVSIVGKLTTEHTENLAG